MNMSISGGENVSVNGITREEAWRKFFAHTGIRVGLLAQGIVVILIAWWILVEAVGLINVARDVLAAQPGFGEIAFVSVSFLGLGLAFVNILVGVMLWQIVLDFSRMHGIPKLSKPLAAGDSIWTKLTRPAFEDKPTDWLESPLFPRWVRTAYIVCARAFWAMPVLFAVITVWWLAICRPEVFNFLSFL